MALAILNEAAALIKVGQKAEAQKLLEPFIEAELAAEGGGLSSYTKNR